ncbi:MAG: tRNA (cytidine(34)-2'-O)-methyltransferase [Gammaproteobacteria bacterium]|jgi:tRNA (cytidine/uridine-2'-O-)-methyltransferase
MFNVVLYQPQIPPNTGNIIRLCANVGAVLHLIRPLAFDLDDRRLRRAGLDYREWATVQVHDSLELFERAAKPVRLLGFSTKATRCYADLRYQTGDALLFGPETRGLPAALLHSLPQAQTLRIPMRAGNRSLNLSNAVAVVLYEAWRQHDFA